MKESEAISKICPLLSSRDREVPYTTCEASDCMMWVTTYRKQCEEGGRHWVDIEGYCAFRKTNYSVE